MMGEACDAVNLRDRFALTNPIQAGEGRTGSLHAAALREAPDFCFRARTPAHRAGRMLLSTAPAMAPMAAPIRISPSISLATKPLPPSST